MKEALLILLLCVISMLPVGALTLHQKGLLSKATLQLYLQKERPQTKKPEDATPIGLAASVHEKQQELERQYQEAKALEEKLELQKQELAQERVKIDERLQALRPKPEGPKLQPKPLSERQEMAALVRIYEGMESEGAASIMEKLSDDVGAHILLEMRRRQASRVMESLSVPKAVAVSVQILSDDAAEKN